MCFFWWLTLAPPTNAQLSEGFWIQIKTVATTGWVGLGCLVGSLKAMEFVRPRIGRRRALQRVVLALKAVSCGGGAHVLGCLEVSIVVRRLSSSGHVVETVLMVVGQRVMVELTQVRVSRIGRQVVGGAVVILIGRAQRCLWVLLRGGGGG